MSGNVRFILSRVSLPISDDMAARSIHLRLPSWERTPGKGFISEGAGVASA